jgi:hypothetical protein
LIVQRIEKLSPRDRRKLREILEEK